MQRTLDTVISIKHVRHVLGSRDAIATSIALCTTSIPENTDIIYTRVRTSQLANKLFSTVDKSRTSCYHLATRLMGPTDSQQVVPTSLISPARNKLLTS